MTEQELSRVLALTGGLTRDGRRSHPSSGAVYPIEVDPLVWVFVLGASVAAGRTGRREPARRR